jgi:hypothetical protein
VSNHEKKTAPTAPTAPIERKGRSLGHELDEERRA